MTTDVNLTPDLRAGLANYHVLAAYDLRRSVRYGDMAGTRRGREIDRLGRELIEAGVPVNRTGSFPESTPAELAAAFERVARPRIRRLERECGDHETTFGTYSGRTKYNGTSLDTWRELEHAIARSGVIA